MRSKVFRTLITCALLASISQTTLARPLGSLEVPVKPTITTEENVQREREAYIKAKVEAEILAHEAARKASLQNRSEVGPSWYYEGDTVITGPHWDRFWGYIHDERKWGVYSVIKRFSLYVLSYHFKTVGQIVSEIAFVFGVIPKEGAPAEAKSYHGYNYWTMNGEYWEYGRWNAGIWVERRDLYGFGWASFIGEDGIPYVDWSQENRKLDERRNCRWGDTSWMHQKTYEVYLDESSPTYFTWNNCV